MIDLYQACFTKLVHKKGIYYFRYLPTDDGIYCYYFRLGAYHSKINPSDTYDTTATPETFFRNRVE